MRRLLKTANVKWSITSNKFVLTQKELRTSEIQKYAQKKCCLPSICLLSLWIHVRVCVCVCVCLRDNFLWNSYTPKIHQIQTLRFLCISLHIQAEILVWFEFVPRNLSFWILWISGLSHFQWSVSYVFVVHVCVSTVSVDWCACVCLCVCVYVFGVHMCVSTVSLD